MTWLGKRNEKVYSLFLGKAFFKHYIVILFPLPRFLSDLPHSPNFLCFLFKKKKKVKKTHLYLHIKSTETETKSYKQKTDKRKTMPKTNKKAKGEKKCLQRQQWECVVSCELLLGVLPAKSDRSCNHLHTVTELWNIGYCFISSNVQLKTHKIHGNTPHFNQ